MDYIKSYQSFIHGRYLSEGIRMTAGILAPALTLNNFNLLPVGLVMSVGALSVSTSDTSGPLSDRINGMLFCLAVISVVVVITGYVASNPVSLAITICLFGFIFSMFTVYGTRTSSVGIAALLVMTLSLQTPKHGLDIWKNSLYIFTGGVWYLLFSLLLYKIRPYKLIQQILGDTIISIAGYLRTRAKFYSEQPDYAQTYKILLQQQADIQTQQNLLSEVIFKTREITKESTNTGRILLMIYLDVAELFESIMTTFQEYPVLHEAFDNTGILEEYKRIILMLAEDVETIGLAVKSAKASTYNIAIEEKLKIAKAKFEEIRLDFIKDGNVDPIISLARIRDNMQDLNERIKMLHRYTTYDNKIKKSRPDYIDKTNYVESQDIRPSLFFDNLNLDSGVFRHAIRVTLALLSGYLISLFFHVGHSYWILLTIVVLLKPAYSLTKLRNRARLVGTFFGILLGIMILLLIKINTALLIIMIIFMAISYIFLRTSYITSVFFMTAYLVIFFHLLYPNNLRIVLTDRLVDTAIGSGIAFLSSLFLVPAWEHTTIKNYITTILQKSRIYYDVVARAFAANTPPPRKEIALARRDTLVALANLSDAFTRMLSEPKRFQKDNETIHRFVVLNYSLTSHIATLSYFLNLKAYDFRSVNILPVIQTTDAYLEKAVNTLENLPAEQIKTDKSFIRILNEEAEVLLQKRKEELSQGMTETQTKVILAEVKSVIDQFNYIFNIAGEIYNNCNNKSFSSGE